MGAWKLLNMVGFNRKFFFFVVDVDRIREGRRTLFLGREVFYNIDVRPADEPAPWIFNLDGEKK
jgi:hypothetical protein